MRANGITNLWVRFSPYFVVLALTSLGHLLGFGREVSLAYRFGATNVTDAFVLGLVPITIYCSVFGSAYANAAIVQIGDASRLKLIRESFLVLIVIGVAAGLGSFLLCDWLIALVAPEAVRETLTMAGALVKVLSLAMLAASLSFLGKSLAQLEGRFARMSFSDLMPNIGLLAGIWGLYDAWGSLGLGVGALAGYLLQFAMVVQPRHIRFDVSMIKAVFGADQLAIFRNMLLAAVSYSVIYIDLIVGRYFASMLPSGSIAIQNYAYKLMTLPLYTVIVSVTTVIFPRLISLREDRDAFQRARARAYAMTLAIGLCITALCVLLARLIVTIVYRRGEFGDAQVIETSPVFVVYVLGLSAHALVLLGSNVLYSQKNFSAPVVAGVIAAIINASLSYTLFHCGFRLLGLAAATTISAIFNAAALWYFATGKRSERRNFAKYKPQRTN